MAPSSRFTRSANPRASPRPETNVRGRGDSAHNGGTPRPQFRCPNPLTTIHDGCAPTACVIGTPASNRQPDNRTIRHRTIQRCERARLPRAIPACRATVEADVHDRSFHLRRRPHADRPLRRRAADVRTDDLGAHAAAGADGAQSGRRLGGGRRRASSAAPTRRARTTATSRAWRCCWPACRPRCRAPPSTGCAAPGWTRSAPPRARSGPARRS